MATMLATSDLLYTTAREIVSKHGYGHEAELEIMRAVEKNTKLMRQVLGRGIRSIIHDLKPRKKRHGSEHHKNDMAGLGAEVAMVCENFLDWSLPTGLLLRKANRKQVYEAATRFSTNAIRSRLLGNFLSLVAFDMNEKQRVEDKFSEEDLQDIMAKAEKECKD